MKFNPMLELDTLMILKKMVNWNILQNRSGELWKAYLFLKDLMTAESLRRSFDL